MEGQIVDNDVKVFVGVGSIQPLEESQKDMAVVAVYAPGLHRTLMLGERSQKTRSAMAGIGCRMPFGIPRSEWKFRLSSVQCLYWDFSSTLNTSALSGGFRYRPIIAVCLGSNSGSGLLPHQ
jgi:hypothetical protein